MFMVLNAVMRVICAFSAWSCWGRADVGLASAEDGPIRWDVLSRHVSRDSCIRTLQRDSVYILTEITQPLQLNI